MESYDTRNPIVLRVEQVERKYGSVDKAPITVVRKLQDYVQHHLKGNYRIRQHHRFSYKDYNDVWCKDGKFYSSNYKLCKAITLLRTTNMNQDEACNKVGTSTNNIAKYHLYQHCMTYVEHGTSVSGRNEYVLLMKLPEYEFVDPPTNPAQITLHQYAGKIIKKSYYPVVHYVRSKKK